MENPDLGVRHHVKQGPVLIDLGTLPSGTRIVPRADSPALFVIAEGNGVRLFGDFGEFVDALALELDGATPLRSLHARGHYDAAANVFTAWRIGVSLPAADGMPSLTGARAAGTREPPPPAIGRRASIREPRS